VRVSFTVALATTIGLLIRQPRMEHGSRQFHLSYVLGLLIGLVALMGLAVGAAPSHYTYFQLEKLIKLLIFVFILIRVVRTPRQYHVVLLAWILGLFYIGYQAQGGVGFMVGGRLDKGLGGPDFAESSDLCVHMVASLPLLGCMFFVLRTWWARGLILIVGALTVNTIILTRTRNAIPGLVAIAIVGVLSLPPRFRVRGVIAVVVGAYLSVQLTDPGWWSRMQTISNYKEDVSARGRLEYWKTGLRIVEDYPLGVGIGNSKFKINEYSEEVRSNRNIHSTPLSALVEMGWPGLALLVGMFAAAGWQVSRARKISRELPDFQEIDFAGWQTRFHLGWHASALLASLAGYFASALFTTRMTAEDMWILLGLSACLYNVALHARGEYAEEFEESDGEAAPTAAAVPHIPPGHPPDGYPQHPRPLPGLNP
jgi:O-antigen ligase